MYQVHPIIVITIQLQTSVCVVVTALRVTVQLRAESMLMTETCS